MNFDLEDIVGRVISEAYMRRNAVVVLFVSITLVFLAVGVIWPKRFSASMLIQIDDTNILQPLMEGRAATTAPIDQVANAREIIYGEKIMNEVIQQGDWSDDDDERNSLETERLKEDIKERTLIMDFGRDLIRITYSDSDPLRAYKTVKLMGDLFIERGEKVKQEESQAAFDFINRQVEEYLKKLTKVESSLKKFRSENPDVRPGLLTEVSNRITQLKTQIERTDLEIREANIQKGSIEEQLSGEAAITISQSREGQYRSKIAELSSEVETLRLDYQDSYPDIIRLKNQIHELKNAMNDEIARRKAVMASSKRKGEAYVDDAIMLNPLYQELRSGLSSTETRLATLKARRAELGKMLEKEYNNARQIHIGEALLSELTRDYEVNQDIYQDLLRRRENARVSKRLDQEHQGLTFKIEEPPKIPVLPTGIRFLHFAVIGPILGAVFPFGIIYLLVQVDPRVRFSRVITTDLKVPVLVELPVLKNSREERNEVYNLYFLGFVLLSLAGIYGYIVWLKYIGHI